MLLASILSTIRYTLARLCRVDWRSKAFSVESFWHLFALCGNRVFQTRLPILDSCFASLCFFLFYFPHECANLFRITISDFQRAISGRLIFIFLTSAGIAQKMYSSDGNRIVYSKKFRVIAKLHHSIHVWGISRLQNDFKRRILFILLHRKQSLILSHISGTKTPHESTPMSSQERSITLGSVRLQVHREKWNIIHLHPFSVSVNQCEQRTIGRAEQRDDKLNFKALTTRENRETWGLPSMTLGLETRV